MKKILSSMWLCAAIVLASCQKEDDTIPISGITLNKTTLSLREGAKEILTATIVPADATNKYLIWSTSNAGTATIADGTVTGVVAGETTITVTTADGSKNAICKVTVEPNYIEVNGIKIAIGNLVADGANGAKIGAPEDGGLYFQAGSLVGWSGGVTGNGIGNYPNSALSAWVTPTGYAGSTTWDSSWIGDDELNTTTGIGDPCKYYLKGTWRLPTTTEYETLFANAGYPTTGPWKAEGTFSKDDIDSYAVHASGLKFSASGWRDISDGSLYGFSSYGAYWSATPCDGRDDWYSMNFSSSGVIPFTTDPRAFGFPVRCIRD